MCIFYMKVILFLIILTNVFNEKLPIDNENCGIRFSQLYHFNTYENGDDDYTQNNLARIINGKISLKGSWPWQISLELLHPQFGAIGHWCGGVLITNKWLLTAAHCIHNDLFNLPIPALWTAILGDWDREIEEFTEQRIQIDSIIIHEKYHNYQHDIALMQLSKEIKLKKFGPIQQICLPHSKLTMADTDNCYATGWGRDKDISLSSRLLQTRIPIHENTKCKEKYEPNILIRNGHLCAGNLNGTTGTCIGDSGGPLQCKKPDGKWYLIGITSFGSGCAKPGYPDVYTKLSFYLPWIQSKII